MRQRNRIYVGTFVSEMLAIDLYTREIVDRFKTKDWVWGSPAFVDDVLYFGDLAASYTRCASPTADLSNLEARLAENAIRSTPL